MSTVADEGADDDGDADDGDIVGESDLVGEYVGGGTICNDRSTTLLTVFDMLYAFLLFLVVRALVWYKSAVV